MKGGPSQVDTFDYKPQLAKDDNKPIYSNSNFTVKERVVLEPGQAYTIGMWKDKEGKPSLNIKVDEKIIQALRNKVNIAREINGEELANWI